MVLLSESVYFDAIIIFMILLCSIPIYFNYCYKYWERRMVPYVTPKFPLGNTNVILPMGNAPGTETKQFYEALKRRGCDFGGVYLVIHPNLVIVNLDYVKDILIRDFHHFVDRGFYCNKNDFLHKHLFSIDETEWKQMRSKLSPTFTSGKMKMMFHLVNECAGYMIETLKMRQEIDAKDVCSCFATDVIGTCAFGMECNSFKEPDAEFRSVGKKQMTFGLYRALKAFFIIYFPNLSKNVFNLKLSIPTSREFFTRVVKDAIKYRKENNIIRKDFLDLLIENNFDEEECIAQVFLFFVAGFDTSSTTMSFGLYELASNEAVQERLRTEINDVLARHNNNFTYESLSEMKYLEQVINETLRMYPPLPNINRKCTVDYRLRDTDIVVKRGTPIIISAIGIHMDPEYYPNPEKFDPERFTEEEKAKRHPMAHIPFGDGPRNCIGLRFGWMQTKIGLAAIVRNFHLKVNPKTKPIELNYGSLLLTSINPLYLDIEHIK